MSDNWTLDDWIESVAGKEVTIREPDSLGHRLPRQTAIPWDMTYCAACDEWRLLVCCAPDETMPHCPDCGRTPGALELGTRPGDEDRTREEAIERGYLE